MGWKAEAVQASTLTLRVNLNSSVSSNELDNMPTKYYRWLNEVHEERRTFFRRLFDEFDDEPSEYRVKKCKECGMDPLGIWWDDYLQRATTSVAARPLGDRVFDLNVLCPPDDDVNEFGCQSCPPLAVPLQTLYALSRLKLKLSKKKDSIRHKVSSSCTDLHRKLIAYSMQTRPPPPQLLHETHQVVIAPEARSHIGHSFNQRFELYKYTDSDVVNRFDHAGGDGVYSTS